MTAIQEAREIIDLIKEQDRSGKCIQTNYAHLRAANVLPKIIDYAEKWQATAIESSAKYASSMHGNWPEMTEEDREYFRKNARDYLEADAGSWKKIDPEEQEALKHAIKWLKGTNCNEIVDLRNSRRLAEKYRKIGELAQVPIGDCQQGLALLSFLTSEIEGLQVACQAKDARIADFEQFRLDVTTILRRYRNSSVEMLTIHLRETIEFLEKERLDLQAALIDSRALYLLFLDGCPEATGWNLDEQTPEHQAVLRRDACASLEMEEPLMMMQMREKDAYIATLEEHLVGFMQDNNGSSCTEQEAREELGAMRLEACGKIKGKV